MEWADKYRRLRVRANADTPEDAKVAREFGAEGIGLCRTEHMFFEGDRIDYVRQMILGSLDYKRLEREIADVEKEALRTAAPKKREELARRRRELKQEIEEPKRMYKGGLDQLLKLQRKDFEGIFKAMDGLPVTIRTLDPPLHEFLPHDEEGTRKLARKLKVKPQHLWSRVESLHEANPMLGHRGCRLGVVFPEITEMQARAIFEAAARVQKKGVKVLPEIMIPLVSDVNELKLQADVVRRVAAEVMDETEQKIEYLVGTMIELPRAALTADKIAEVAEFFSFGTNDLTQTTYGISRDDSGKFLPFYIENRIFDKRPVPGVGSGRRRRACEDGHRARPSDSRGFEGRHLRRARRRAFIGGVLSSRRVELRFLFALSSSDRAAGSGPGGARQRAIRLAHSLIKVQKRKREKAMPSPSCAFTLHPTTRNYRKFMRMMRAFSYTDFFISTPSKGDV